MAESHEPSKSSDNSSQKASSGDSSKKNASGDSSKKVQIIVALIALTGVILAALIDKMPSIEFSHPQRAVVCAYNDEPWTVLFGDWIPKVPNSEFAHFSLKRFPRGLLIGGKPIAKGSIESRVRLLGNGAGCMAHFAYGFQVNSESFFTAGLGGEGSAYSMGEYRKDLGWKQLSKRGDGGSLSDSEIYRVTLVLTDGRVVLKVDGNEVVQVARETNAAPSELGLWVEGCDAEFICTRICPD